MEYILYTLVAIIIIILFFKQRNNNPRHILDIPKYKYDRKLHVFSAKAVESGRVAYGEAINQNKDNPNKERAEEYASLIEDLLKFTVMYLSTSKLDDVSEVERQALYWAAWSEEYEYRIDDMEKKYDLKYTSVPKEVD
jgi:hypothetical protein